MKKIFIIGLLGSCEINTLETTLDLQTAHERLSRITELANKAYEAHNYTRAAKIYRLLTLMPEEYNERYQKHAKKKLNKMIKEGHIDNPALPKELLCMNKISHKNVFWTELDSFNETEP